MVEFTAPGADGNQVRQALDSLEHVVATVIDGTGISGLLRSCPVSAVSSGIVATRAQ
jgi:hypothetical protein